MFLSFISRLSCKEERDSLDITQNHIGSEQINRRNIKTENKKKTKEKLEGNSFEFYLASRDVGERERHRYRG